MRISPVAQPRDQVQSIGFRHSNIEDEKMSDGKTRHSSIAFSRLRATRTVVTLSREGLAYEKGSLFILFHHQPSAPLPLVVAQGVARSAMDIRVWVARTAPLRIASAEFCWVSRLRSTIGVWASSRELAELGQ